MQITQFRYENHLSNEANTESEQLELISDYRSYGPIDAYDTDEDPYTPVCVYGLPALGQLARTL